MLERSPWPPDYYHVLGWRQHQLVLFQKEPWRVKTALLHYKDEPIEFIKDWCDTYDPRKAGSGTPATVPFCLFRRQEELIAFLYECITKQTNGLVEKCRDIGATWGAGAFSVWAWLLRPGASIGWGSRKELLVDKLGDPDSIFEKMRIIIRGLPPEFMPAGFNEKEHLSYMRIINPENGSTITGEAGDNIGRGGRKLIYFKDEAQPLDAKILTPTGYQFMADMKVGSLVIGVDGKCKKVLQVKDCGIYDIYRVTFSDGTFTECSPGHLWDVKEWKKIQRTMSAQDLAGDLIRVGSRDKKVQYRYRIETCSPVFFEKQNQALPLDPYVVGALLGDGSVKSGTPGITSMDQEIVDQISISLPVGCVIRMGAEKDKGNRARNYRIIDPDWKSKWTKSRSMEVVKASGIYGHGALDKFIPDAYKFSSPEDRLALLQGLMDTDGSVSSAAFYFCSISKQLAEDVRFIVHSLGGIATLRTRPNSKGHHTIYAVNFALPEGSESPFRLTRKKNAYKRKQEVSRTIMSMELVGRKPVRCITIDSKDGLYLTDHCIVTHNSAWYEHPESIEAALTDNTNCQIDISSVSGLGTVFERKRSVGVEWDKDTGVVKGKTNVFVFDWRDHPAKDQAWYDERRRAAEDNGLLHLFAQEVERNYAATVEGTIVPAEWIESAVDAHVILESKVTGWRDGGFEASLDVADGGGDRNALAICEGVILEYIEEWGERDTGATARRAIATVAKHSPIDMQYDCIGVGSGVKAEANRLQDEKVMPKGVRLIPWDAGAAPLRPDKRVVEGDRDSPLNKDFYQNLKAQGWWELRRRFEKTHNMVQAFKENKTLPKYKVQELISISSKLKRLNALKKEINQVVRKAPSGRMRLVVDKMTEGMRSPNMGDAVMQLYWPATGSYDVSNKWVR